MSWNGMNTKTGLVIADADHINQSVSDILRTPIGSRLMRREYGSEIFKLIDQPQHGATRLRLMSAAVVALLRWEPRIQPSKIDIGNSEIDGSLIITTSYYRKDQGYFGAAISSITAGVS